MSLTQFDSGLSTKTSNFSQIKITADRRTKRPAYEAYFRTKLKKGLDKNGDLVMTREVIKYSTKEDAINFNEGTVIATGSGQRGEDGFTFTDAASDNDRYYEGRISSNSDYQSITTLTGETKKNRNDKTLSNSIKNFRNNKADVDPNSNKDNSNPAPTVKEKERIKISESKTTRKNYGNYCYPTTLRRGDRDRLKITVLKFSPRQITGFSFGERRDESPIGSVVLPVPGSVNDANQVQFKGGSLNPVQTALAGLGLDVMLGQNEAIKALQKRLQDPNLASDVRTSITNLLASRAVGAPGNDVLARTGGGIVNPNLELLFSGPTLRPFNFNFKMSPRDRGESIEVKKIIRMFKQSSAVQLSSTEIFLKSPNIYKLEFLSRANRDHDFLPKIKRCALTGFGVNYTPEGTYMSYENSSMISYSISFSFQELEPITNSDYTNLDNNIDKSIGF